ncbi:MAG: cysteine hydrolase [Lachnospiraceae bacterium]|nr:cysteine hydrolase [Lachnospiraceae bacterium]
MKNVLVVIDMQNDFTYGALKNEDAIRVIPAVKEKVAKALAEGREVIYTQDTHKADYLKTHEGRCLPVEHCISKTEGWQIVPELMREEMTVVEKPAFGSFDLADRVAESDPEEIELVGVCTDICVISNALILRAAFPEADITVDARCCAGVTPESHDTALQAMRACHIEVTGQGEEAWR